MYPIIPTISIKSVCFLYSGLSPEARMNIWNWWIQHSVPSPCKQDTIRKKDMRGQLVLLEEINSDEKYEEAVKQYYTETDKDLYKSWQYENTDLFTRERLSKGQPLISLNTFTKYPNWVQHAMLSLCPCC